MRATPTARQYVTAIALWLAAPGLLLFLLSTVDKLLRTGEICSRLGCRSWSSEPASISFTVGGLLCIVLVISYAAVVSARTLFRRR